MNNTEHNTEENLENVNPNMDGSAESMDNESTVDNGVEGVENEKDEVVSGDPVQAEKEKYLRLYSEFENFRRRTTKERLEWMQTASKDVVLAILPVIDDMERALKAMGDSAETASAKEGMELIYKKLTSTLEKQGLKPMKSVGETFDADLHEAITQFAAPSPDLVGKVIDEVEKGYMLGDKVIRFAKVVVGN